MLETTLIRWLTFVLGAVFLVAYFGMQVTGGRQKLQRLGHPLLYLMFGVLTTLMFLGSLLRLIVGWYAALAFALVNIGDVVLRMLRQKRSSARRYIESLSFLVLYGTYLVLLWTQAGRLAFRK